MNRKGQLLWCQHSLYCVYDFSAITSCYIKRFMCHFTLSTSFFTHQSASKSRSIGSYISFPPVFKVTWEVAPFEIFTHNVRACTVTHLTVDLHTVCVSHRWMFTHTSTVQGCCKAVKSHQHAGTCCTCVACKALWDMFSDPWQNEGLSGREGESRKRAADKESLCAVCMQVSDCASTRANPAS